MSKEILISVIIGTRNRCEYLKNLLPQLCTQETGGAFSYEIIVADNNSNDRTKEVAHEFMKAHGEKVRYIFDGRPGKANALNSAVAVARGSIVAFTDDDVNVTPQWLMNVARCFEETKCDGLGGRVLPDYPPQTPQWVKDNIDILTGTIVAHDYGESDKVYAKPMYEAIGANYAFRKSIFDECGLFRTDLGVGTGYLGEDTEIINRLERHKKIIYYCGGALVTHPVDLNRAKLDYIAKWNIALGRYRAFTEKSKMQLDNLVCYFGVPRYLIRVLAQDVWGLAVNAANKREFLKMWIKASNDWGRAQEIAIMIKRDGAKNGV